MGAELEEKVRAQYRRFEAELPGLLTAHGGQWVVYHEGVKGYFRTEDEAIRWAVTHLGLDVGFVVAEAKETKPVLLTAALAWRFGT